MTLLFDLTLALYALACGLYLSHLSSGNDGIARVARVTLAAAFLAHTVDIGALCVHGVHPFVNAREALSFVAWLTIGAYLGVTLRYRVPVLGALVVPVTMVLDVAARVGPTMPGHSASLLADLHIGLATAGIALFAVAAGDAAVFLAAEKQLKRHRLGKIGRKGPPLETLDRINRACILAGFPLFTVAMVMGALLAMRVPGGGVHRLLHPEYLMSVVAWVLYAALITARVTAGWRGRRAAWVTLAGFTAAVGVLVIYYAHTFHQRA
jgi:ABC-type uncharacterized transport system permease subunit